MDALGHGVLVTDKVGDVDDDAEKLALTLPLWVGPGVRHGEGVRVGVGVRDCDRDMDADLLPLRVGRGVGAGVRDGVAVASSSASNAVFGSAFA